MPDSHLMQCSGALGSVHEWVKRSKIWRMRRLGRTWRRDLVSLPVSFINSSWGDLLLLQREALATSFVKTTPLKVGCFHSIFSPSFFFNLYTDQSHHNYYKIPQLPSLKIIKFQISHFFSTNILLKGGRTKTCWISVFHCSGALVSYCHCKKITIYWFKIIQIHSHSSRGQKSKINALAGLCSFWRIQRRIRFILFLFFYPLEAACTSWLMPPLLPS